MAVAKGHEEAALFLVNQVPTCDVDARTAGGVTPLMLAAQQGRGAVVRALVAKGAQVDAQDAQNRTALVLAAMSFKDTVATYLVAEAGAAWEVEGGRVAQGMDKPWLALCNAAECGMLGLLRATLRRMRAEGPGEDVVAGRMVQAAAFAVQHRDKPAKKALMALEKRGALPPGGMVFRDGRRRRGRA